MTKQRKMVSSVSSKYLNYNTSKNGYNGDGTSTINGEGSNGKRIGNFNDY